MANTSEIRNGLCIHHNNDIYSVVEFQHVKPGKGAAFVRTKLKSVTTGKVLDNTFPAGHKIDIVRVERRNFQYLYEDDDSYHFMNNDTFEQIGIKKDFVEHAAFLKEGMIVEILFQTPEEIPLLVELPQHVEMEITYTEPGVKGDTATNATKPATVESGAEVRVPLFINSGDRIKIDVANRSYVERVKK